ncbi:hypothetical protein OHR86_27820 [Streptomyces sp. NBC_00441]|uniref:hypothetical protein n=1 Tax=Streptomyces sp. NBC_00441 TaxID=2975742 RepID=UPI002E2AC419|nr:hypothetical protein [Streptomyces sp. NBC_00441]
MSRITGAIGVSVDGDDRVDVVYTPGYQGRVYPTLRIGNSLGLDVTGASPEVLRQIAEAAEELAGWAEERDTAAQVAAEDGVRSIGVPAQRGQVAA